MASTSERNAQHRSVVDVTREGAWLIARFATPQRTLSWAIVGGGFHEAETVAWLEVRNKDLTPTTDPCALLTQSMAAHDLNGVGLLTSRRLDAYVEAHAEHDQVHAHCVATVGLGNALRAGDPLCDVRPVGTINILCHVSVPLTDHGMLEALALASEAKALAVREGDVPSISTRALASGTGTDCIVIACPRATAEQPAQPYAGKHTTVGHLVGAAVLDAVARGVAGSKAERQ